MVNRVKGWRKNVYVYIEIVLTDLYLCPKTKNHD